MKLCNKISQSSVVKIISKKELLFKVKLGLQHDNPNPAQDTSTRTVKIVYMRDQINNFFFHTIS